MVFILIFAENNKCMRPHLVKTLIRFLRDAADNLDAGNSELSDAEAMDLAEMFCHKPMNKYAACKHLNMSRSKFDLYIRMGELPRGKKIAGSNALIWYKDELDACATNIKRNNKNNN